MLGVGDEGLCDQLMIDVQRACVAGRIGMGPNFFVLAWIAMLPSPSV